MSNGRSGNPLRPLDPRRIEVIDDATAACLRAMPPHKRVEAVLEMFETGLDLARCGVRHAHPDWSADQIEQAARQRVCDAAA